MIAERSMVVRTGIQLASPLAAVVAAYLFFAGHNQPGGGFAAGLVLGAVVALRMVVGLSHPRRPTHLLVAGGLVVGLAAFLPVLGGGILLDQVVVEGRLPVVGSIKTGSALVFDLGVTLIVVGLVSTVLLALRADELAGTEEGP
jgi:multicomponent Na+:H+ antiporter subunit A